MNKPIRVYVAAPYSDNDTASSAERERNTRHAMGIFHELRRRGYYPLCPHWSHWQDQHRPGSSYADWMDWCLMWVAQCDVLCRFPGPEGPQQPSAGRGVEVERANRLGIPVLAGVTVSRVIEKLLREFPVKGQVNASNG